MIGAKSLTRNRPSAPLASHPAFTPLVVGWAALLFGLSTFVVGIGLSSSFWLPAMLSVIAAAFGAFCGYKLADSAGANVPRFSGFRKKAAVQEDDEVDVTGRRGASIINTQELGSASLDAPLDLNMADMVDEDEADSEGFDETAETSMLSSDDFEETGIFSDDADSQDEDRPNFYEDPFAEDGIDGPASPNDRHAHDALGRPRYDFAKPMDLGRSDGEPTGEHAHTTPAEQNVAEAAPKAAAAAPLILEAPEGFEESTSGDGGSSDDVSDAPDSPEMDEHELSLGAEEADAPVQQAQVIDLKDRDLKDLTLVQMVDRFAVGLQDHRKARANDPSSRAVRPSDPRIAQAIRDLPIGDLRPVGDKSTRAQAEQTEAALREALEKLQQMSDHG